MRGTPGLLVLSALLGMSFWVFVTEEENPTRVDELGSPVLVQSVNVETGLAVANQLPSVELVLAAPEERWEEIRAGLASFTAFVDLRGDTEREQEVRVQIEISGVRGVRVVEVIPQRVIVNLEDLTSVEVPIRVRAIGPLPFGYEQGATSVEPASVMVTGPASLVSRVSDAVADITVTGFTLDIERTVTVIPRGVGGGEIRGVTLEPSTARVGVEIRSSTLVRTLQLRVAPDGAPAPGYRVTNVVVSPSTVTVEGTLEALAQLDSIALPDVDVTGELSDVIQVFDVTLPPGLSAVEAGTVTVLIQIAPIDGNFTFALVPVVVGLADGLTAEVAVESVSITLQGPLPLLNQLTADDLEVTLDVTSLGIGIHEIAAEVTVPDGTALQAPLESVPVTLAAE